MQFPSDEELMSGVRSGDVRKLAVLFDRHHASLFRYAMKMTGNRTWSEDLVQEIFVRLLKYRETFRDGHPFPTWMFRIARNTYIDQTRKKKWEVHFEDPIEASVFPTDDLEQEQDLMLLRRALQKLPEQQREILILARFQQLSYEEISGLLGIGVGTVKTRIHRATKQLRDIYFELTREPYALRTNQ